MAPDQLASLGRVLSRAILFVHVFISCRSNLVLALNGSNYMYKLVSNLVLALDGSNYMYKLVSSLVLVLDGSNYMYKLVINLVWHLMAHITCINW